MESLRCVVGVVCLRCVFCVSVGRFPWVCFWCVHGVSMVCLWRVFRVFCAFLALFSDYLWPISAPLNGRRPTPGEFPPDDFPAQPKRRSRRPQS